MRSVLMPKDYQLIQSLEELRTSGRGLILCDLCFTAAPNVYTPNSPRYFSDYEMF
ncbi:unnamed protein product [Linum tenue]|uniref:Uncharacterized protein n=1 Tax=Linum tenue TaxID=586396 RepID=A0AAV0KDL8_9ROSI|nr:unnamed protein product [Linum tenue]